jgi:hypothetical protein
MLHRLYIWQELTNALRQLTFFNKNIRVSPATAQCQNLQVVLFTDGGEPFACRCQYLYCTIGTLLSGHHPKGINFT